MNAEIKSISGGDWRDAIAVLVSSNVEDLNLNPEKPDEWRAKSDQIADAVRAFHPALAAFDEHGLLVGLALVTRGSGSTEHVGGLRLVVDKQHWGQGIGSALLDGILRWAKADKTLRRVEATPYMPLTSWKYGLFIENGGMEIEGVMRGRAWKFSTADYRDVLMLVKDVA